MNQLNSDLIAILDRLHRVDAASIDATGGSRAFLEVRQATAEAKAGIIIGGNAQGLTHLARLILDVAHRGFDGAHHHLDESSDLDKCDIPVVIRYTPAEWDEA